MPLNIVKRDEWLAEPPSVGIFNVKKFNRIFLVNSHTETCEDDALCEDNVRKLQHKHIHDQKEKDIYYNFLVGGNGSVYEGRGWTNSPVLPKKFSRFYKTSLLIAFIGHYTADELPEVMDDAACGLIKYGLSKQHILRSYQYFDIMTTEREERLQETEVFEGAFDSF